MSDAEQTRQYGEPTVSDPDEAAPFEDIDLSIEPPEPSLRGWQVLGNLRERLFDRGHGSARVGRYRLLDKLGQGGLGVVYAAHDPELDRKVALKLLRPEKDAEDRDRADERLLREARAIAKLTHRNVVEVFDVGSFWRRSTVDDGTQDDGPCHGLFIVMQLLEGETLEHWLRAPRAWRDVLAVMDQAGRGLAAAHDAGLVHRDFKPANVFVCADGTVKVLDFGLARTVAVVDPEIGPSSLDESLTEDGSCSENITQTGVVLGTPSYMAPEQHLGGEADHRSDQFAFCVALFRALYGNHPFVGRNARKLFRAKAGGRIAPPDEPHGVPKWLGAAVRRGLCPAAEDRHPSMGALLHALQEPPKRKWGRFVVGAVGVAAAAGALAIPRESASACVDGASRVHEIWDAAARDAVRSSFASVASPLSKEAFGRVDLALDDYADTWAAIRLDTCGLADAAEDTVAVDRRMRCLDGRAAHLDALVNVLADADAKVVEQAAGAAASLPPLGACVNDKALAREHTPPPASAAAGVADVQDKLALVDALELAGRYEAALAVAQAAIDAAAGVDYAPSQAKAIYARGRMRDKLGRYEGAIADLSEATTRAMSVGNDAMAAGAASSLIGATGKAGDFAAAQRWSRFADALLERIPTDAEIRSRVAMSQGLLLQQLGRYEDATERLELALAVAPEDDPLNRAMMLANLGNNSIHLGKLAGAHRLHSEAMDVLAEALGEGHPAVATTRLNLGIVAAGLGRPDEARQLYLSAREALVESLGANTERVAHCDYSLAELFRSQGDHTSAEAYYWAAESAFGSSIGPEHPKVAVAQLGRAAALLDQGRMRDAMATVDKARNLISRALGDDHPIMTRALIERGRIELALGRPGQARSTLDGAVELAAAAGGDPQTEAEARMYLATAMWAAPGDRAEARAMVQRSLAAMPATVSFDQARTELSRWLTEHPAR